MATYYIDFTNGANTNPGTKTNPWKSHPYMRSATGCTTSGSPPSYTHVAGDQFIFKGGEQWPAACFQMNVTLGGSGSGTMDYYGVDKTYFSGSSWVRPQFNLNNTAPSSNGGLSGSHNVVTVSSSFTNWDNIEIVGQFIIGGHSSGNSGWDSGLYFSAGGSGAGHVVQNVYFHDWVSDTSNINLGFSNAAGGVGQNGSSYTVHDSTFSDQNGQDLTRGVGLSFGGCFQNASGAYRNHCSYVSQGAVNFFGAGIHDNEFDHITDACCVSPYTNGIHTNVIEMLTGSAGTPIYNNLIHDNNPVGVTILACSSANIYNNVLWNNHAPVVSIDTGTGFCPNPQSNTANVYNNTVVCTTFQGCFSVNNKTSTLGTLNLQNNHWVSENASATCYNSTGCATVTNLTASNNVQQTSAQAAAQGYNQSNKYIPTGISGITVKAGADLHTLCSGNLSALCSDPESAPWFGGTSIARPNGGWDSGAYQFPTGNSNPPTVAITSPTANSTVSNTQTLTTTCVPVSPNTISQTYFQIDGTSFGAVGSSSPYSVTWDTTTASNASHSISAFCVDSQNLSNSSTESVTVSNNIPGCFVSSNNWSTNQSFTTQTGVFTAVFSVTPNGNNLDAVAGLSNAVAGAYGDMAAIIRFNASGNLDVINSTTYQAINTVAYTSGTTYSFTMTVDIIHHIYSVQLTSPSNTTLATNYAFRNTQSSVSSLGFINTEGSATPNTLKLCNLVVTPVVIGTGGSNNLGPAQRFTATIF